MTSLGKLKLEFNNDAMKLKKYVLQAKTHIINNLAKKSKKIKSHKGGDEIKVKLNKKAESLIIEISLLKKVKYNDLVRFAMTNTVELNKLMNTPVVTMDKVMAKLLSHKILKPRIEALKEKFKEIPVSELLEPNPVKAKKKIIKEKRAEKKSKKENAALSTSNNLNLKTESKIDNSDDDEDNSNEENEDNSNDENEVNSNDENENNSNDENEDNSNDANEDSLSENESLESIPKRKVSLDVKTSRLSNKKSSHLDVSENKPSKQNNIRTSSDFFVVTPSKVCEEKINSEPISNSESVNKKKKNDSYPDKSIKNKNLIDLDDVPSDVPIKKTVDSFFVTETGDNYMTMALPRPPDDLKKFEDSKFNYNQGNRKMRRAAQYGNDMSFESKKRKPNPRDDNMDQSRFSKNVNKNSFSKFEKSASGKSFSQKNVEPQSEKLHPSWEAKKQISSIVNFAGKKTVFTD